MHELVHAYDYLVGGVKLLECRSLAYRHVTSASFCFFLEISPSLHVLVSGAMLFVFALPEGVRRLLRVLLVRRTHGSHSFDPFHGDFQFPAAGNRVDVLADKDHAYP